MTVSTNLINKTVGIKNPKWVNKKVEEHFKNSESQFIKGIIRAIYVCERKQNPLQAVVEIIKDNKGTLSTYDVEDLIIIHYNPCP